MLVEQRNAALRATLTADLAERLAQPAPKVITAWSRPAPREHPDAVLAAARLLVAHRSVLVEAAGPDEPSAYAQLVERCVAAATEDGSRGPRRPAPCTPRAYRAGLSGDGEVVVFERAGRWRFVRAEQAADAPVDEASDWAFRTPSEAMKAAQTHYGEQLQAFAAEPAATEPRPRSGAADPS